MSERASCAVFALLVLAGCGRDNPAPELYSIAPNHVDSAGPTEVVLRGANLFDAPHVDLTAGGRSPVQRDWRVPLGDSGLALTNVEHPDSQTLRAIVPAGTPAGTYDVVAISPLGAAARLSSALVVSGESASRRAIRPAIVRNPAADGGGTIDPSLDGGRPDAGLDATAGGSRVLSIESAAGGVGTRLDRLQATTDQTVSLFAIWRDANGRFVAGAPATWSVSSSLAQPPAIATATWLVALDRPGVGVITARDADRRSAQVGLDVEPGHAHTIVIQPDHGDLVAGGAPLQFEVRAKDAAGNDTDDVGTLSWSIANGAIGALEPSSGRFTPQRSGSGQIAAVSSYGASATSGTIRVRAGPVAALTPSPQTAILSADAAPLTFSALAFDAFGNPTSDVGVLSWTIDSGAIGNLSSAGVLDPRLAGTGRLRVTSSLGPSAITGDVQITPGRAASLSISPNGASTMVGNLPIAFSASGRDADGNLTSDLGTLTFSIASGPITSIAADSGIFTPHTAGVGTIAVGSSYGLAAISGNVRVDPFVSQVKVSALRLPDLIWPNQDSVRIELDVENDGARDVALTGAYFALSLSGNDVTSQYTITSDYNEVDTVRAGSTNTLVYYFDVGASATNGTLHVNAMVDVFHPSGPIVSLSANGTTSVTPPVLGPTVALTAPNPPADRLCLGGSASFGCSISHANSPTFAWLLPSGFPSSSAQSSPSALYNRVGAFDYSITLTDSRGLHAAALAPNPIFVGQVASRPDQTYPTGNVAFKSPNGNGNVDLSSLPRSDLIAIDPTAELRQCDGTPVDPLGARYVTLFVDRGQIDPSADDHPELPGIQVDLDQGQGRFGPVNLLASAPLLEGAATLYGEFYQSGLAVVTAAGSVAFQMVDDTQAPSVIESLPAADCGSGCWAKSAPFIFRFSEAMNVNSLANVKVERLSGSSCIGPVSADLSFLSLKFYDTASNTLFVYPASQASTGYLLRVTLGSQLDDASSNSNALTPFLRCAGVTTLSAPSTPTAPVVSLDTTVVSPDGDGVAESLVWNVGVDANTRFISVHVSRGNTVLWSGTALTPAAGSYAVRWYGRDSSGRSLFNDFYRYDIVANNAVGAASAAVSGAVQVNSAARQIGVRRRY